MRLASIITLLLLWYSSAPAQTLKYTPIPPAAAEVIAALPNAQHLDSIRQNYVAAPLQVRDGVEVILVEGRCRKSVSEKWVCASGTAEIIKGEESRKINTEVFKRYVTPAGLEEPKVAPLLHPLRGSGTSAGGHRDIARSGHNTRHVSPRRT